MRTRANQSNQFNTTTKYSKKNQLSLFDDGKTSEIRRKSRKPCPYCGFEIVSERLEPENSPHHSRLVCLGCDRFLVWVKKEKSLLNSDGSRRRLRVVAIPPPDRKGNAFCRVVDEDGEIVADQLGLGETDHWFEVRGGESNA